MGLSEFGLDLRSSRQISRQTLGVRHSLAFAPTRVVILIAYNSMCRGQSASDHAPGHHHDRLPGQSRRSLPRPSDRPPGGGANAPGVAKRSSGPRRRKHPSGLRCWIARSRGGQGRSAAASRGKQLSRLARDRPARVPVVRETGSVERAGRGTGCCRAPIVGR